GRLRQPSRIPGGHDAGGVTLCRRRNRKKPPDWLAGRLLEPQRDRRTCEELLQIRSGIAPHEHSGLDVRRVTAAEGNEPRESFRIRVPAYVHLELCGWLREMLELRRIPD